jgi:hypothetical protein
MDRDEIAAGYSKPKSDGDGSALEGPRQPGGSYPASIPSTNSHDRGSGSDVRSREFSEEGKGFDGVGNDKPSPGREAMGSTRLPS